jgi:hypothetical protein
MSRFLLTQDPRHLPPWLIFDVRQKTKQMKTAPNLDSLGKWALYGVFIMFCLSVIAALAIPQDQVKYRRIAFGGCYFFGLPAVLSAVVLTLEKLKILK